MRLNRPSSRAGVAETGGELVEQVGRIVERPPLGRAVMVSGSPPGHDSFLGATRGEGQQVPLLPRIQPLAAYTTSRSTSRSADRGPSVGRLRCRIVRTVIAPDPVTFLIAVILAAAISSGVFVHASRHGSHHATAWGVAAFLAAGVAVPLYFIEYWARRAVRE